jgi:hypothetical protein
MAVQSGRQPADAGMLPPVAYVAPSPSASPPAPATRAPTPGATRRILLARPGRLTIGALKVDAPVDPVGVGADRGLAVPDDPQRLGWWMGSALPGAARGTVLVAGHVDTARDGRGALFALAKLAVGSRIEVRAGGRVFAYRTVARRTYQKEKLPRDLFRADTSPRLALVTCGGSFADGVYSHNVVVYAEPLR